MPPPLPGLLIPHASPTAWPLPGLLQYPDVNHATIDGKPAREVGAGAAGCGWVRGLGPSGSPPSPPAVMHAFLPALHLFVLCLLRLVHSVSHCFLAFLPPPARSSPTTPTWRATLWPPCSSAAPQSSRWVGGWVGGDQGGWGCRGGGGRLPRCRMGRVGAAGLLLLPPSLAFRRCSCSRAPQSPADIDMPAWVLCAPASSCPRLPRPAGPRPELRPVCRLLRLRPHPRLGAGHPR